MTGVSKNPYKNQSVSFSSKEDLLARAMKRAESQGRSFSNYVVQLIRADLANSGYPDLSGGGMQMHESSSSKIEQEKDGRTDLLNHKIRKQRKPSP